MSFFALIPFRPLPGSSTLAVTRSIFDMMLIQGTSRFTIADIADMTPLTDVRCSHVVVSDKKPHLKNLYLSSMNCDSIR